MPVSSCSSIGDLQASIEEALQAIRAGVELPKALQGLRYLAPPRGYEPRVSFRRVDNDRKIREDASSDYWTPESARIQIEFAPQVNQHTLLGETLEQRGAPSQLQSQVRLNELVMALDRAERDPAFRHFVALKTFRDTFLPAQGIAWAASPETRHSVLRDAIEQNWVLKSTVPNPKTPQFPVTAIRLNRALPQVQAALEANRRASPFAPVTFSGEPLSRTVINDRR